MNKISFISVLVLISILVLSCDKEVFTGPPDDPIPQNGRVAIESNPTGAKIYLNGRNMGITTPDTLKWLKTGTYVVTLKLGLFNDSIFTVNATDGALTDLYIDYYLNPGHFGKIECKSTPPDADITLNDVATGYKTPHTFTSLFPGTYKVKLTYPECRDDSSIVTVRGGKTFTYNPVLDDTTTWVSYNVNNSPVRANYLSTVVIDKNNTKWIGFGDRGVARFSGKNWTFYTKDNSALPFDAINSITVDSKNNIWVGTTGGLAVFNGSSWVNYSSNLPGTYVTSVAFDNLDRAWIGTNEGLVRFDGSTWQVYRTNNSGIPGNFVLSIDIDNQNRVWLGTNAFGIGMFDGTTWKVYNMANMNLGVNLGNGINSITVDNTGIVWAAHISSPLQNEVGGLSRFDGTSWTRILVPGVQVNLTESIYVDENNFKWLGTKGGAARFTQPNNPLIFTSQNSKLPVNQVKDLVIDKNGDLWFATFGGGLAKLKKGNF
jgi:ligand-binding sensor domain-containing protein